MDGETGWKSLTFCQIEFGYLHNRLHKNAPHVVCAKGTVSVIKCSKEPVAALIGTCVVPNREGLEGLEDAALEFKCSFGQKK